MILTTKNNQKNKKKREANRKNGNTKIKRREVRTKE